MKKILIILLSLLLWEKQCYANPTDPIPMFSIPALFSEAIIIALFARLYRLDWARFLLYWPFITWATWIPTIMALERFNYYWLTERNGNANGYVIIVESVVVVVEAVILRILSKMKYFQLKGGKPFGWLMSFIISAIVNVSSFLLGAYLIEYFMGPLI